MVQDLPEGREETKRVEKRIYNRLAQRRLRRKGKGFARAQKEKAKYLIAATMKLHFGEAWESLFNIEIRNRNMRMKK